MLILECLEVNKVRNINVVNAIHFLDTAQRQLERKRFEAYFGRLSLLLQKKYKLNFSKKE